MKQHVKKNSAEDVALPHNVAEQLSQIIMENNEPFKQPLTLKEKAENYFAFASFISMIPPKRRILELIDLFWIPMSDPTY